MTKRALLWLFVLFLGITFGAGLYEARVEVPLWVDINFWNADRATEADSGVRFWVFITSIPLTLLTIANLFCLRLVNPQVKKWWLASVLFALADRVMTFTYFVPVMLSLMEHGNSREQEIVATAIQWANLNYVRLALVLLAWLAALKTMTLLYQSLAEDSHGRK